MNFRKRARNAGKVYGLGEDAAVQTLTVMHEIIEDLIDMHIVIHIQDVFRTKYESTTFQDNIKTGANKKYLRKILANKNNLHIRPEQKFV